MQVLPLTDFVCPIDRLPLIKEGQVLKCKNQHGFDLAREGYCNLLLVQDKASLDPGDNKEMVAARRRFLENECFSGVANFLFEIILEIILKGNISTLRIVDAGCGEGYYLNRLSQLANSNQNPAILKLSGFDISKWAVKAAARRSDKIAWAVASNKNIPFVAGSIDLILSMFGFSIWESFKAVQTSGARVLLVDPGPEHLIELRKIIYPTVTASPISTLQSAKDSGYILEKEVPFKFQVKLNKAQIQDLLAMTPHGYRVSEKGRKDLDALTQLTVSVDLSFRLLRLHA